MYAPICDEFAESRTCHYTNSPADLATFIFTTVPPLSTKNLKKNIATLNQPSQDGEDALCCGGSLGNVTISTEKRNAVTKQACDTLLQNNPDVLVTSCPMCKKTFQKATNTPVMDLAELVNESLMVKLKKPKIQKKVEKEERITSRT